MRTLEDIIRRVVGKLAAGQTIKAMEDLWMVCPDNTWAEISIDSETTQEMKTAMNEIACRQPGVPIKKKKKA